MTDVIPSLPEVPPGNTNSGGAPSGDAEQGRHRHSVHRPPWHPSGTESLISEVEAR